MPNKQFKNFTLGMFRQWFREESDTKTYTAKEVADMLEQACPLIEEDTAEKETNYCAVDEHLKNAPETTITTATAEKENPLLVGKIPYSDSTLLSAENEGWKMEFDSRFAPLGIDNSLADGCGSASDYIKDFIRQIISQSTEEAVKKERERIVEAMPLEQIHQLPDDVGSPHETEFDRGWNSYRKELLDIINKRLLTNPSHTAEK